MELKEFLRTYRKNKKLSVRKFAEMLDVSKFRLEKWEQGIYPNYEDGTKIRKYFGLKNIENISEEFLNNFQASDPGSAKDEMIKLKDQIIEEKEKRIQALEETIHLLRDRIDEYGRGKG